MLNIGCHLSISKGFYFAGKQAAEIGANTFQYFTRNPRGGGRRELDQEDVKRLHDLVSEYKFAPLFAHAPYTMNLCSDKEEIRTFAKNVLKEDIERLKYLPKSYYIFHPGSHMGQGADRGIDYIVKALNEVIDENNDITVLLEGMSGKGSEVGKNFQELKAIIDGVKYNRKLGVCLDTCHLHSAGYDIVNDLDKVLDELDKIIGFDRVLGVHLNDNKNSLASFKDRHEVIGGGSIGLENIIKFINHPRIKNLTFNLETPNELDGYEREINLLRKSFD
ncbi:MAG: deoxyribonuclease IV [Bacillota bacterium]|nr:deoxyribonuclease IV [Bacillota bacterium]